MKETNLEQIGITFKGSGSYIPNQILDNEEISKLVDTSDEWITTRTGISFRRISRLNENVANMGYAAAKEALDMAKWSPESIDLIIFEPTFTNLKFLSFES